VFGTFKFLDTTENKMKGVKGKTLKIYHAMAAFYKAAIIPIVRWSFIGMGFCLESDNLFAPLAVNPEILLGRIAIPEIPIEEFVTPDK
jgi:hypothetical protein